jgi:hypothetical protein
MAAAKVIKYRRDTIAIGAIPFFADAHSRRRCPISAAM